MHSPRKLFFDVMLGRCEAVTVSRLPSSLVARRSPTPNNPRHILRGCVRVYASHRSRANRKHPPRPPSATTQSTADTSKKKSRVGVVTPSRARVALPRAKIFPHAPRRAKFMQPAKKPRSYYYTCPSPSPSAAFPSLLLVLTLTRSVAPPAGGPRTGHRLRPDL